MAKEDYMTQVRRQLFDKNESECPMPTDDERREVARNMRDSVKCKTECELLSINGGSAAIRWLISYVVFGDKKYHSGVDLMNRLADLIEPQASEQTNPQESSLSASLCDRDALLALADEYENDSKVARTYKWSDPTCASMAAMLADEYGKVARRIREALGVGR